MNAPTVGGSRGKGIVHLRHGVVTIDGARLINRIDFSLTPHAVTGLIGPNGAGKSTLLKVLARQQALSDGDLFLDERPYSSLGVRAFAQRIAYLPQAVPATPGMTVDELVCLGRFPWHGSLGRFTDKDRAAVDDALAMTGMSALATRFTDSLSGGERQRCWIAMLLAQEAGVLLLDEPVSALDARHQIEMMALIRRISRNRKTSILIVLHDINLAAHYCDQITALRLGRTVWEGAAMSLMDVEVLGSIYDTPMSLVTAPGVDGPFAFATPTP